MVEKGLIYDLRDLIANFKSIPTKIFHRTENEMLLNKKRDEVKLPRTRK